MEHYYLLALNINHYFQNIYDTIRINNNITNTIKVKRTEVYVGGVLGGSRTQFIAAPSFAIKTKKGRLYGYHYDLISKTHNINYHIKLGK